MKIFGYIMWGIIIFDYIMIFLFPHYFCLVFSSFFENHSSRRYAENLFSVYPWDENRIMDSVWDGQKACVAGGSFLFRRKREAHKKYMQQLTHRKRFCMKEKYL